MLSSELECHVLMLLAALHAAPTLLKPVSLITLLIMRMRHTPSACK